jgi:hypothetical protein
MYVDTASFHVLSDARSGILGDRAAALFGIGVS